jgi:hypothetical protein
MVGVGHVATLKNSRQPFKPREMMAAPFDGAQGDRHAKGAKKESEFVGATGWSPFFAAGR